MCTMHSQLWYFKMIFIYDDHFFAQDYLFDLGYIIIILKNSKMLYATIIIGKSHKTGCVYYT